MRIRAGTRAFKKGAEVAALAPDGPPGTIDDLNVFGALSKGSDLDTEAARRHCERHPALNNESRNRTGPGAWVAPSPPGSSSVDDPGGAQEVGILGASPMIRVAVTDFALFA